MRKIIGIAALARSGKDTVASLLLQHHHVAAYALADPLKSGCQSLFGLTDKEAWNDSIKEQIIPLWNRSPRKFFQHIGTDWMRSHNPDHWLMRAERAINPQNKQVNCKITPQLQDKKTPFKLAAKAFFGLSEQQTWDNCFYNSKDDFWEMTPKQMFDLLESYSIKDFPDYYERRVKRPITLQTRAIPFMGNNRIIIIKDIRFENEATFLRNHNGQIWHIIRDSAEKVNAHSSELGIEISAKDVVIDNNGTLEQLAITVEREWQYYSDKETSSLNL